MVFDPTATRSGAVASDEPSVLAAWICYVNGVEVPIVGFSVTSGVWQPPRFEITMVADPSLRRLGHEDRVPVQIFYLDHWYDPDRPAFRLLVDGEIVAYRSRKAFGNRYVTFSCMSHVRVFEDLYFFFMNTVDDIVAAQSPEVRTQGFTQQGLFYPYSLFHQGLFTPTRTGRDAEVNDGTPDAPAAGQGAMVKTPFEIAYNVIRGIVGNAEVVPNDHRSLPMMNFFARYVRKTRLHRRVVRHPLLEDVAAVEAREGVFPIFAAVRAHEALSAMQHTVAGRIGNSGSIWDMFKQIYGLVFMEFAVVANPAAVVTNLDCEIIGPVREDLPLVDQSRPRVSSADRAAAASAASAPSASTGGESAGLVAVQQEIATLEERVTRLRRAQLSFWNPSRGTSADRPYQELQEAEQRLRALRADERRISSDPRNLTPVPGTASASPANPLTLQSYANFANVPQGVATDAVVGVDPTTPISLAQCFVKPQGTFAHPPHCNVFFPSHVSDFGYEEDYAQPTRLYVSDSVMAQLMRAPHGPNREFLAHALTVAYPDEADAVLHQHLPEQGGGATPHATGRNLLIWPEEVFAGPRTARMELPAWFQMLMQTRNSLGANEAGGGSGGGAGAAAPTNAGGATTGLARFTDAGFTPVTIPPAGGGGGSGRSYRNGTPEAFNREWGRRAQARWNGEEGRMVRGMAPVVFGTGVAPEIFIGFGVSAGRTENTTTAKATQRFHEVGIYGVEAGLREGPAPNPDPRAPYSRWALFANTEDVRNALAAIEGAPRPATLAPGGWVALADQTAVGLKNLKEHRAGAAAALSRRGIPTTADNSQWGLFIAMMAWSAGDDRVANTFCRGPIKRAIAAAPQDRRVGVAVKALFEAGRDRRILPGPARSHTNPFYSLVRTLQKYEVAKTLAQATGNGAFYDLHLGPELPEYLDLLTRLAYVPQFDQDVRGRVAPPPAPPAYREDDHRPADRRTLPGQTEVVVRRVVTGTATPPGAVPAPSASPTNPAPAAATRVTATVTAPAPAAAPSAAPASAASTGDDLVGGVELTGNEKFAELFRLYAQYEFLRQKYDKRPGAVMLRFNPYPVPGYPAVVFDRASTREHLVGLLSSVNHTGMVGDAGSASWGSSATLTSVRTLEEFLNDVRNDANRFADRVTAAPAEIVPEIRRVLQDDTRAEVVYQRLFYGGPRRDNIPAAFRFTEAIGYARGLDVERISIEATQREVPASQSAGQASATPAHDQLAAVRRELAEAESIRAAAERNVQDSLVVEHHLLADVTYARGGDWDNVRRLRQIERDAAARVDALRAREQQLSEATHDDGLDAHDSGASSPRVAPNRVTFEREVSHNLDPNKPITPLPDTIYVDAWDNYNVAMQLSARNVCTLEEFIRFWHGGRLVGSLQATGEVQGPRLDYAYRKQVVTDAIAQGMTSDAASADVRRETVGQIDRPSAVFYDRIFRLRAGPGRPLKEAERGYTQGANATASASTAGVPGDYPETRADWDAILVAYREKVRNLQSPQT